MRACVRVCVCACVCACACVCVCVRGGACMNQTERTSEKEKEINEGREEEINGDRGG